MTPREELESLRRLAELEAKAGGAPQKPKGPDDFEKRIREEANQPAGFMANLGAGANNVIQGVKQLAGRGETDAEIDERRAMNDRAAGDSTWNKITQGVGEILPTLAIPGLGIAGVGGKVAARALPRALGAAAEAAPAVAGKVLSGATVAKGAVAGGAQSFLNPLKSDESSIPGLVTGATVGGAIPGVAHGAGKVYDRFSAKALPAASRAWEALRTKLGPEEMGRVSGEVVSPHAATLPNMTTAAMADSAPVAALERGARQATPDVRNVVDAPRNQSAYERVIQNTVDPELAGVLSKETTANVQAANAAMRKPTDPQAMIGAVTGLEKELAKVTKSSEFAVSRTVQDAVARVEAALMDPKVNPERLSLLVEDLHVLNEKAGPAFGPKITQLQNSIREAVDKASGFGQTNKQGVLQADQAAVDAAKDAARLRGKFVSPEGVPLGDRIGDTPLVTDKALRDTMGGLPNLDAGVRDEMSVLADALRRSELHKASNSPGPTGLDLTEPLNILGTGSNNPLRWIPGVPGLSRATTGRANEATTKQANEMILKPGQWSSVEDMLNALRDAPLSTKQKLLQNAMNVPGIYTGSQFGD